MDGFVERLKSVLASRDVVDIGQFQWIGLDMVRRKAGDDWIRISKTVYDVSARFIESKLGPEDALIRARGGFIVIFGKPDPKATQAAVQAVSEELNRFFQKDELLCLLGVSAQSETVSAKRLLDRVAANVGGGDGPAAARFGETGWKPLEIAKAEPAQPREEAAIRPSRPEPRRSRPVKARKLGERLRKVEFNPGEDSDSIVFKPCWDAREQSVSAYFCLARRLWHGQNLYSRQVFLGENDAAEQRALDAHVAAAANSAMLSLLRDGGTGALIIPSSYGSMSARGFRKRFFDLLSQTPREERARLMVQLDDIPPLAPLSVLREVFAEIHAFGGQVLVKTPFGAGDLHHFRGLEIDRFGAAASLKANRDGMNPVEAEALGEWTGWAEQFLATTYLTQAEELGLVGAAAKAGVRYFAGDAIGADCPAPRSAWRLALSELDHPVASA